MYQDRVFSKAAFIHHTKFLSLEWTDSDRNRVINSLYSHSISVNKANSKLDVASNEVFPKGLKSLPEIIKPKNLMRTNIELGLSNEINIVKSGLEKNQDHNNVNYSNVGISIAITLYKRCKIKRVEKLFIESFQHRTKNQLESYSKSMAKKIEAESRRLRSLGYDRDFIRYKLTHSCFLPKRIINSSITRAYKKKYKVKVQQFILYEFTYNPNYLIHIASQNHVI